MNTSTIEARKTPAKRLGIFALGIAVACAGMFGMAASKAEAGPTNQPFQMQFDRGLLNLGAAFVGKQVLPAPSRLPGSTSNLPNWWDIVTSGTSATLLSGASANACTIPTGAASGANAFFPCNGNPESGLIRAVGGTGNFSAQPGAATVAWPFGGTGSTWNPTTGDISLARVVPGGGSPNGQPYNYDVQFPIMQVPSPTTGSPVPLTLVASGAVTGTYNSTTGALSLAPADGAPFEARVLVGLGIPASAGGPQPFTYCKVPLPGLTLTTGTGSGSKGFPGTPFESGLEGTGALQGTYTVADNSTSVTQSGLSGAAAAAATQALASCATAVDLVIKGDGGLWFGNRVQPPACEEGQIGTYPDCTDPKANTTKIAVTGKKSVKKGKKVKLTVKVTNSGTADESVKLRLWSSNGGVASVTGQATVSAPAGGTGTKTVTVTAKKKKGKTTIHATNGAKTGKLTVTVK